MQAWSMIGILYIDLIRPWTTDSSSTMDDGTVDQLKRKSMMGLVKQHMISSS
jgi:hypothetical protein